MTTQNTTICSHCGGPVSAKGPSSKSGKRYCSNKGCQAAKARARRQVLSTTRDAPSECAGCRKVLPPRQWRAGDEHGRWCQKPSCRQKRRDLSEQMTQESDALQMANRLENAVYFLAEVVMCDDPSVISENRVVCRTCGLTNAIRGWPHRQEDGSPCRALMEGAIKRPILANHLDMAWPSRREYLSAAQLEAAYGD